MKKSFSLFVCFFIIKAFLFSQGRFSVENVYGNVKANDGSSIFDPLVIGTKLSCEAGFSIVGDGSVTISHPDLPTMVFRNEGKYLIKDKVIEIGIINDCEAKVKDVVKTDSKSIVPNEVIKLSKPYNGVLVPGLVKIVWEKPKATGSFIVEVSLPNDKENPLASFNTDNTFVELNLKALELTPGNEYYIIVKSKNAKIGPTEVKFTAGDFDEYRKVVNALKVKNQYLSANPYKREIMEADLLEKSKYLYLASSKYDKLLEKFTKNEEVMKAYTGFYERMQLN
ncbi:MAG TPA: hypothetical protein VK590_05160 [Saprospiraceae bacterium]|nr:hypothetical protein [Saprospiraceae bacterium]